MKVRIIGDNDFGVKRIKNNLVLYIIVLILFAIGIVGGTFYYKNVADEQTLSAYVEKMLSTISSSNMYEIFCESVYRNTGVIVLFWILGVSLIGVPVLLCFIIYKGFNLGFTISAFISTFGFFKGNAISFSILFFQNTITLFTIIIAMGSSMKFAINVLKKRKDIKYELIRHTTISTFCAVGLFVSSIFEAIFKEQIIKYILAIIK